MGCFPKLALLMLALLFSGQAQAQMLTVNDLEPEARDIALNDPCADDLGVASPSDNLSCEFVPSSGGTFCYFRSELCNNNTACVTGSDESNNIAALDCTGNRAGTGFPVFECTSGESVSLEALCDGHNNCSAGDDEVTPLCENKCRFPYYGGCPYTRQCLTSALDVGCPRCLLGFVEDPDAPTGSECFPLINITFELGTYNTAEGNGFVEVCAVLANGMIEPGQSFTTLLETSPVTASTADFGELNPPAVLTFTSTQSRDCANISITDDNIIEQQIPPEFFNVILSSNDFQVNIITNTAQVFIADNDNALFEFTQNTYTGSEGANIPFAIRLAAGSAVLSDPVTVTVTSGAGSAIANLDYMPVSAQITFPAGSGPATTLGSSLIPIDDNRVESLENVQLSASITAGTGSFTSNGNTANIVIQDNDVLIIGFRPTTYQVSEADGQIDVCFRVEENNVLDIARQAALNTQSGPGSAIATVDFTPLVNEMVNLPIGTAQGSEFCRTITILQDGVPENLESFSVLLTSQSAAVSVNPATNLATVNILGDRIVFAFSQDNFNVNEGDGLAEVCIDLISGVLSANTPIDLTPQTGSAGASDFTPTPATVIFPTASTPGERRCINISINDDILVELAESFSVSADSNDPNVEFMPGGDVATVTIMNNDIAQFRYTQSIYVVGESNGPAQPAIELVFGILTFDIDVDVATVPGGTATAALDYINIPTQRLTFPSGSSPNDRIPFNVQILPDGLVEGDETVNLTANSPSNFAVIEPNSAQLVIDDDDQLVIALEQTFYQPLETDGSVEVCYVILQGVLDTNLNPALRKSTMDGTAVSPADYVGIDMNVPLSVGVGSAGQMRFCDNIIVNDDNLSEGNEEFLVNLQSLNPLVSINPAASTATVEIRDDDNIVFEFDELVYDTTEGGVAMVMVCVNLISGVLVSRDVTVNIVPKQSDPLLDTATPITDYGVFNASLLFPLGSMPGQQECFNLQQFINNDIFVENSESFRISLTTSDAGAQFTPGRDCATASIADNDQVTIVLVPPPGVGVPNYATPENTSTGSQEICVMIQGAPANILQRPVTVNLGSSDGPANINGAQSPADYGAISSPIIFSPGQEGQQMCRQIPIFDDVICEGDELFNVALTSTDPGVNLGQSSTGMVTIIDNDVATISADQIDYIVNEQDDLWITLHLDGQKGEGRECVVSVMTVDGTATDGQDYIGIAGNYVFNSTVFTQRVKLDIINDNRCEGDEDLEVFLSTNSPDCLVATPQLSVTIRDDEIGMGDDPHFSIYLPSGEMLCYTVQGEHGFAFNLINNKQLIMNAKFVPDARREEVTWLGSMGIIIQNSNYGGSNDTRLRFEAQEKTLYINDKVVLSAKNVEKLTFSNGKMTISETSPKKGFHYPSLLVDLQDVEVSFTIKYTNQHLDMFWHSTGKKVTNSHGIIGQFFRKGVDVDTVRKILIMPNKEPVPVMRRPVWSFMERETPDDQLCWTAMNPGYQGEGLIDGTYLDYLVDDVMSTDFKFKQ